MRILDVTENLEAIYPGGSFDLEAWKRTMTEELPSAVPLCMADLREGIGSGLSWEKDYLPVLNALRGSPEPVAAARESFAAVTKDLENKILRRFGKTPDAEIILYPGLCSGAGWVTELDGKTAVLLGIEKIVELGWCSIDDMNGLILHELGHAYQKQFGVLYRDCKEPGQRFLWQLFTEGIAMVFEQEIVGDPDYFHEDKDGWKDWCDAHLKQIAFDFERDRPRMTRENQRYFGDWVRYEEKPDVGYYLGARFVRFVMREIAFDKLILFSAEDAEVWYRKFLRTVS